MKHVLMLSLAANLVAGWLLWSVQSDYSNLLNWACEHASLGGYQCGEDWAMRETDEQYYQRHYKKAQADIAAYGVNDSSQDGAWSFFQNYPRNDPTSPQRFRADNGPRHYLPLAIGIVGSMVLTPFGGIALAVAADTLIKWHDERVKEGRWCEVRKLIVALIFVGVSSMAMAGVVCQEKCVSYGVITKCKTYCTGDWLQSMPRLLVARGISGDPAERAIMPATEGPKTMIKFVLAVILAASVVAPLAATNAHAGRCILVGGSPWCGQWPALF
jgi:hypothetical protein